MAALVAKNFSQVGFVVKDIEAASKAFAALFGCEVPPACPCGRPESETIYKGAPAPEAKSKLAFFNLSSGVALELIEPGEAPSTWREHLDTKGEGLHHIAFNVDNTEEAVKACEALGMQVVQRGFYDDLSGQYTYLDGGDVFHCVVELLESFHK